MKSRQGRQPMNWAKRVVYKDLETATLDGVWYHLRN